MMRQRSQLVGALDMESRLQLRPVGAPPEGRWVTNGVRWGTHEVWSAIVCTRHPMGWADRSVDRGLP